MNKMLTFLSLAVVLFQPETGMAGSEIKADKQILINLASQQLVVISNDSHQPDSVYTMDTKVFGKVDSLPLSCHQQLFQQAHASQLGAVRDIYRHVNLSFDTGDSVQPEQHFIIRFDQQVAEATLSAAESCSVSWLEQGKNSPSLMVKIQ